MFLNIYSLNHRNAHTIINNFLFGCTFVNKYLTHYNITSDIS